MVSVNNAFQCNGVYLWHPSGLISGCDKWPHKGTRVVSGNRGPGSVLALLLIYPKRPCPVLWSEGQASGKVGPGPRPAFLDPGRARLFYLVDFSRRDRPGARWCSAWSRPAEELWECRSVPWLVFHGDFKLRPLQRLSWDCLPSALTILGSRQDQEDPPRKKEETEAQGGRAASRGSEDRGAGRLGGSVG